MQAELQQLIDRRRGRAIKAILRVKERDVDPIVPPHVAAELRRVVLEELNDLTEVVVAVVDSLLDDSTTNVNEHWISLVEEIHGAVVGDQ